METVYAGLPFYDSLEKTDRVRTGARVPFNCPRHQLLPFQINVGTDNPGAITKSELLGCSETYGTTNLISAWSTGSYETFTTNGAIITSAINAGGGGSGLAYTGVIPVNRGDILQCTINLTLNSGQLPFVFLFDPYVPLGTYGECSDRVTLAAGVNVVELSPTIQSNNIKLAIYNNGAAADWSTSSFSVVSVDGRINITSYFASLPALFTATTNDYFQYKGGTLKYALPRGQWRVKLTTANGYVYYSENIAVSDIYQNQITKWQNAGGGFAYDTFISSGAIIASAISLGATKACKTSSLISVRKGEALSIYFSFTLNSGQLPNLSLQETGIGAASNVVTVTVGINMITITATRACIGYLEFINTAASNFSTSEVFVHRSYSPRFIRIDMSNAKDLGNILYQDSWAQTLFLETRLNYPTTEVVEVGDEKDGIFNPEKIVTKYIYRISTYINRAMHRVLSRISQHSSVTITDEVGNTYTPSVGNIRMEADQPHFETTHAVISFNDGENTAYDWTYDMENMT